MVVYTDLYVSMCSTKSVQTQYNTETTANTMSLNVIVYHPIKVWERRWHSYLYKSQCKHVQNKISSDAILICGNKT